MKWRVVVVAGALAALLAWWLWPREATEPTAAPVVAPRSGKITLDIAAARSMRAAQVRGAKELATKAKPKRTYDPARQRCNYGPSELCEALADLFAACVDGDAATCLAVGQFLADTPPRPLEAASFFFAACRLGDERGCEYQEKLMGREPRRCDDDPFVCGWRARRLRDEAALEQACTLGVGDACAALWGRLDDADPRGRHFLELACQHGNPATCLALGKRLAPDCAKQQRTDCYPPDADQANAAFTIACEAGFEEGCD